MNMNVPLIISCVDMSQSDELNAYIYILHTFYFSFLLIF